MNNTIHSFIMLVLVMSSFCAYASEDYCTNIVECQNDRFAYIRGEIATISVEGKCSNEASADTELVVDIGRLIHRLIRLEDIQTAKGNFTHSFQVNTGQLKVGSYQLICSIEDGEKKFATAEYTFFVAGKSNPDRMRVWLWPHHKFGINVYKLDDTAKKQLDWYADKGFNSFNPGCYGFIKSNNDVIYGGLNAEKFRLYDYMLCQGWDVGFTAWNSFSVDVNDDATFQARRPWNNLKRLANPFLPEVVALQNKLNENIVQKVALFPHVKLCFVEGEIEDCVPADIPMSKDSYKGTLPTAMPHKFIAPGVIDDNDEGYLKRIYQYKWGDGLAVSSKRIADVVHKYRDDVRVFSDPLRRTTVYDRFSGMDIVSSWTYTGSDPKLMLYIETLIANAKPLGRGVLSTVTFLNYPGSIAPKDKGWTIMGPDRLVETSWINLSRNPEGLSYYIGSGLDPFNPGYPSNDGAKAYDSPQPDQTYQLYTKTYESLKKFVHETVQPYGPMIRKLERTPRRIAVL